MYVPICPDDRAKASDLGNLIFEVTIKNGAVSKLKKVAVGSDESGREYDEENMAYGNVLFDDSTIVFAVDVTGAELVENDNITVGAVTDYFVDGEGKDFNITAYDEDDNDYIAGAIIGFGLETTVPLDGDAVIITGVRDITYNDEEAVYITGIQAGKEVAYTLYDDDESYSSSAFKKGDVILVGVADAEGVISHYDSLYKYDATNTNFELGADADIDEDKEIYYYAGKVDYTTEPTDSTFFIQGMTEGIVMKNTANYTLVDYTESTSNPEVSRKSKGKSIFGTATKYESLVFVRYYDDKIKEVVVYRYDVNKTNDAYDNTVKEEAAPLTISVNVGTVDTDTTEIVITSNVAGATISTTTTVTGSGSVDSEADGTITFSGLDEDDVIEIDVEVSKAGYTTVTDSFEFTVVAAPVAD